MMKLQFEKVLEYVEQGETDPRMKKHLRMHPDGPELLRQARLMNDMMKRRAEEGSPDDDWAGSGLDIAAQFESVQALEVGEPVHAMLSESAASYKRDDDHMSPEEISRLQDLAGRAAGHVSDVGSLRLAIDGRRVVVSFESDDAPVAGVATRLLQRSAASKDLFDDNISEFKRPQPVPRTVEVRGDDISISVNAETTIDGTLNFRITDRRLNVPARGLQMLFMPEDGPFVRFHTDAKGVARLAVPHRSGILRIESQQPQLLHIKIKKK